MSQWRGSDAAKKRRAAGERILAFQVRRENQSQGAEESKRNSDNEGICRSKCM